jgi:hypothetical protein
MDSIFGDCTPGGAPNTRQLRRALRDLKMAASISKASLVCITLADHLPSACCLAICVCPCVQKENSLPAPDIPAEPDSLEGVSVSKARRTRGIGVVRGKRV